jgi:hypothetical protein
MPACYCDWNCRLANYLSAVQVTCGCCEWFIVARVYEQRDG